MHAETGVDDLVAFWWLLHSEGSHDVGAIGHPPAPHERVRGGWHCIPEGRGAWWGGSMPGLSRRRPRETEGHAFLKGQLMVQLCKRRKEGHTAGDAEGAPLSAPLVGSRARWEGLKPMRERGPGEDQHEARMAEVRLQGLEMRRLLDKQETLLDHPQLCKQQFKFSMGMSKTRKGMQLVPHSSSSPQIACFKPTSRPLLRFLFPQGLQRHKGLLLGRPCEEGDAALLRRLLTEVCPLCRQKPPTFHDETHGSARTTQLTAVTATLNCVRANLTEVCAILRVISVDTDHARLHGEQQTLRRERLKTAKLHAQQAAIEARLVKVAAREDAVTKRREAKYRALMEQTALNVIHFEREMPGLVTPVPPRKTCRFKHCQTPGIHLPNVGAWRKNGRRDKMDWLTRPYHSQCYGILCRIKESGSYERVLADGQ